jgi:hypothetical protein
MDPIVLGAAGCVFSVPRQDPEVSSVSLRSIGHERSDRTFRLTVAGIPVKAVVLSLHADELLRVLFNAIVVMVLE